MMIRLRRIVSLSQRKHSMFCSQNKDPQIQRLEHKAYLASKIISKISQINLNRIYASQKNEQTHKMEQEILGSVRKKSLAKSILEMIQQQKIEKKLNDQAVKYMESFFTTGVIFDNQVFNQARILSPSKLVTTNVYKFRFLPTYTVTSFIFNQIIEKQMVPYKIFTGHYGISKSISTMLYTMLSGIISEYYLKTFDQQLQMGSTFDQKLQMRSLKHEIKKFPIMLYYTYNIPDTTQNAKNEDRITLIDDANEKFSRQCVQKFRQNIQCLKKFFVQSQSGKISLQAYYLKRNMTLAVMIDQFNIYTKLLRSLEILNKNKQILLQKLRKTKKKTKIFQEIQNQIHITDKEIKNTISFIQQFVKLLTKFRELVGSVHFLSSVGLQRSILRDKRFGPQRGHSQPTEIKFDYLGKVPHEISAYQIVDTFLFIIQQKIGLMFPSKTIISSEQNEKCDTQNQKFQSSVNQNQMQSQNHVQKEVSIYQHLRTLLYNQLKLHQGRHALTFYTMRMYFQKKFNESQKTSLEKALKQKSISQISKVCKQKFLKTINYSLAQLEKKYEDFVNKNRDSSEEDFHRIQACLYVSACDAADDILRSKGRKVELKYKKQLLTQTAQKKLIELIDHHLFEYDGQEKNQEKLCCLIPPAYLIYIMDKTIYRSFKYLVQNKLFDICLYADSSSLGKILEGAFIDMLNNEHVHMKIKLGSENIILAHNNLQTMQFKQIPKFYIKQQKIQELIAKDPNVSKTQIIKLKIELKKDAIKKMIEKQKQNAQKQKTKLNYNNKVQNRIDTSYDFIKSQFRQFLKKKIIAIKSNDKIRFLPNHTFTFVPENKSQQYFDSRNIFIRSNNFNNYSKAIDLMLVNIELQQKKIITINAIDITKSLNQTYSKIEKFVQEFCCFQDRHKDEIQFYLPAKQTFKIELNYFVYAPGNINNNIASLLNNNYEKFLRFTPLPENQNICSVKSNEGGSSKSLLKHTGFLKIGEDLIVDSVKAKQKLPANSPFRIWKQIERQSKEYEQLLKDREVKGKI